MSIFSCSNIMLLSRHRSSQTTWASSVPSRVTVTCRIVHGKGLQTPRVQRRGLACADNDITITSDSKTVSAHSRTRARLAARGSGARCGGASEDAT